jgi:hypothetical protein
MERKKCQWRLGNSGSKNCVRPRKMRWFRMVDFLQSSTLDYFAHISLDIPIP